MDVCAKLILPGLLDLVMRNHRNETAPTLGGVFGRKAGAASGFPYSPALREADLRWSADVFDHWVTDPRKFVPDACMPIRVLNPASRRDIIAYLKVQERLKAQERPSVAAGTVAKSP